MDKWLGNEENFASDLHRSYMQQIKAHKLIALLESYNENFDYEEFRNLEKGIRNYADKIDDIIIDMLKTYVQSVDSFKQGNNHFNIIYNDE